MYRGHPNIWGTPILGCPLNMCGHSHMFGCPQMFGRCLDAPVHTQHKESMLCHTKRCQYAPYIWMPHMFGWPPVCLNAPIHVDTHCTFGCSQCLDTPVCLDATYIWTPLYVWIMFGCPPYIHNTKKACFVTLRECPYAPIYLDAPLYVWMCLMFGCPHLLEHRAVCLGDVLMPLYIHNI